MAAPSLSRAKGAAVNKLEIKAFVDRIEEDRAIVLLGEEGLQVVWPLEYLPEDAREGCALRIAVQLDEDATKQNQNAIDSLIDRLQRGD